MEAEGIYVGYKYYETRYYDSIVNPDSGADSSAGATQSDAWNYDEEVLYDFGHGLSYLDYTQSLKSVDVDCSEDGEITAVVEITNNSDQDGRFLAQLYVQQPYTDYDRENLVEKSAVMFLNSAKTDVAAGETEEVTITVPTKYLASYDYTNAKTYILDDGDYIFTAAAGAHEAINNILAEQGYTEDDGMDADGMAVMIAFNRIGATNASHYAGMLQNILRGEWGYTGLISTDMMNNNYYFNPESMIMAGITQVADFATNDNHINMGVGGNDATWAYISEETVANDAALVDQARENLKYQLYTFANSAVMNVSTERVQTWWDTAISTVTYASGVLAQMKLTGMAAAAVEIVSGILRIAATVLLTLCLVTLITARVEGLGFIYFSNADVLQEVQTPANMSSAAGTIANMICLGAATVFSMIAAFFNLRKKETQN